MMIAVGLARFGLDLPEQKVQALFEDGCGLPLVQSTISRLSVEFLVRWRMLCEERLPFTARALEGLVVQFDGTGDPRGGGRVTYRAREACHGLTLWADPLVSESEGEVARFYETFREHYGTPRWGCATAERRRKRRWPGCSPTCRSGRTTSTSLTTWAR